jgi:hypothetical protein
MEKTPSQPLTRAHAALLEDLRKLELALNANPPPVMAELRIRLVATRDNMVEHFRAQEQNSSMESIERQQPYLETAIHRLADEHRSLAASLDALIREATRAAALAATLRDQLRAWIGQVRRHEAHEVDFIQDAIDLDIGTKD